MKILLAMILLVGGVVFYRMKFTAGSGEDLQGRWTIVSAPEGWKVMPGMDINVTPDEIQVRIGTVVTTRMHYEADSESGTIDATQAGGKLRQGIYRIEGETLTLSVGGEGAPRPATPDIQDSGGMRWILKRGAHL